MTPNASDVLPKERRSVPTSATHLKLPSEIGTDYSFKRKVVWFNAIGFLFLHLAGIYGVYRSFLAKGQTMMWMILMAFISGEGVTIGAHRLYSHRAFKATFPVRLLLLILHTIAGQNCLYIWVRDHRQHHKYSDTDADPHNAHRGFFFSHVGWLMSRKHPAVISKGKTIDMSDLEADQLVMLQKKYYKPLYVIFALALPILIPVYFWDETYYNSLFVSYFARYVIMLNITWLVNSAAHFYGTKPYDKHMKPVESWLVSLLSQGEGWHNYHHAFPWDYRAAELGTRYSMTTFLINMMAACGLVYDLRTTPHRLIEHRVLRTGDGSHPIQAEHHEDEENLKYRQEEIIESKENEQEKEHGVNLQKRKGVNCTKEVGAENKLKFRVEEVNGVEGNKNESIEDLNRKIINSNGFLLETSNSNAETRIADNCDTGMNFGIHSDVIEGNNDGDKINGKSNDFNVNERSFNNDDSNGLEGEAFASEDEKPKTTINNCLEDKAMIKKNIEALITNERNVHSETGRVINLKGNEERVKEKETLLTNTSAIKRHIAIQG